MYENQSNDLRDILETLQELNQAIEQQAGVRIQLEAEKAALARRLYEALAAERRQRCRAMSSRAFAKRVQVATQPVIAVQKELVSLKRELAMQKKSFQEERRTLEEKVCALQQEIVRIKEENEAALAVADFAKEDAAFIKSANHVTSSSAVPNSRPVGSNVPGSELIRPATPPPLSQPARPLQTPFQGQEASHPRNGNNLWTGSGQLVWNPSPVNGNLTTRAHCQMQFRPRRPTLTIRYKAVAGFQTASMLLQADRREGREEENQACDSRVSQSDSTSKADEQIVSSDDDCIIVQGDEADERQLTAMVKTENIKTEKPQEDYFHQEERIQAAECVGTDMSQRPAQTQKPRKKRRMFSTPLYDNFIE